MFFWKRNAGWLIASLMKILLKESRSSNYKFKGRRNIFLMLVFRDIHWERGLEVLNLSKLRQSIKFWAGDWIECVSTYVLLGFSGLLVVFNVCLCKANLGERYFSKVLSLSHWKKWWGRKEKKNDFQWSRGIRIKINCIFVPLLFLTPINKYWEVTGMLVPVNYAIFFCNIT